MDFEMKPYIVYIQVDEQNRIIAINSSAFLNDVNGWIEIDSGYDDKYHHAQGNYFDKPLYDDYGIHQYKFIDGVAMERTVEEMSADYIVPENEPTQLDIIEA
jgi:hypothetical protein